MIPAYVVVRTNRKTIAIYIRNGQVVVRAPLKMPQADIDHFVTSKAAWINKHLANQVANATKRELFELGYGSEVMLRGNQVAIVAKKGKKAGFDGQSFYMPPGLTPQQIKAACVQVYKMVAKAYISSRVKVYAAQMGVMPTAVKINAAARRWGSCSAKKSLNFSWRLIMACDDVADYVVVHELAHIFEMNHSVKFWAQVAKFMPDYAGREDRLKALQQRLASEDWG